MAKNKNPKERGLFKKYNVTRADKKPLKGGCVVLEFGSKNTAAAILQFAESVDADGYHALAQDLRIRIGYFQPSAETAYNRKKMDQQAAIDNLHRNLASLERCLNEETKRLSGLLTDAHELIGRLTHQMDRHGIQPTAQIAMGRRSLSSDIGEQEIRQKMAKAPQ